MAIIDTYERFIGNIQLLLKRKWPHLIRARQEAKKELQEYFDSRLNYESLGNNEGFFFEAIKKDPDLLHQLAEVELNNDDLYFLTKISCVYIFNSRNDRLSFVRLKRLISSLLSLKKDKLNQDCFGDFYNQFDTYYRNIIACTFYIPSFPAFDVIIKAHSNLGRDRDDPWIRRIFSLAGSCAANFKIPGMATSCLRKIQSYYSTTNSVVIFNAALVYSLNANIPALRELIAFLQRGNPMIIIVLIAILQSKKDAQNILGTLHGENLVSEIEIQLAQLVNAPTPVNTNQKQLLGCMVKCLIPLMNFDYRAIETPSFDDWKIENSFFVILDAILANFPGDSDVDEAYIVNFFQLIANQFIERFHDIFRPEDCFALFIHSMSPILPIKKISAFIKYCIDVFSKKPHVNTRLLTALMKMISKDAWRYRINYFRGLPTTYPELRLRRDKELYGHFISTFLARGNIFGLSLCLAIARTHHHFLIGHVLVDLGYLFDNTLNTLVMSHIENYDLLYLLSAYYLSFDGVLDSIIFQIICDKVIAPPDLQRQTTIPRKLMPFFNPSDKDRFFKRTENMRQLLKKGPELNVFEVRNYLSCLSRDYHGIIVLLPRLVEALERILPREMTREIFKFVLPENGLKFVDLVRASYVHAHIAQRKSDQPALRQLCEDEKRCPTP